MKTELIFLVIIATVIVSCSSKKTVPVTDTIISKEKTKEVLLTTELMEGKSLYENSCARCHKLYESREYSQEDWKPILIRMQKKAHLDDVQISSISNYIMSQL